MSIGVAIIGGGIFAREEHLPAVQAAGSLSLKAVYSRSLKSAQSLTTDISGIDLYSENSGEGKSYADLLARSDIQAVIIALPILTQPEYIRQALSAGKHVLAEKPVAKDVAAAAELIKFYREKIDTSKINFSIAENFRYLDSFVYGAEQVKQLGRVLGFRQRMHTLVKPGTKYFETAWRKVPEYQGGFLLDGGVHFVAGMRLLLGKENAPEYITAFTAQLQEHLPPIDTINATWKTKSGVSGTFSTSFGTAFSEPSQYFVSCEKGSVVVSRGVVRVEREGKGSEEKTFSDEGSGVKQEVKAWAESLVSGKPDAQQTPEEAFKDLQLVEAMIQSGEKNGAAVKI